MPNEWLWFYWPLALVGIVILFAIPEALALSKGGPTFSFFMWTVGQKWPPWIFLWGMLVGGLVVHFLWHWVPPASE